VRRDDPRGMQREAVDARTQGLARLGTDVPVVVALDACQGNSQGLGGNGSDHVLVRVWFEVLVPSQSSARDLAKAPGKPLGQADDVLVGGRWKGLERHDVVRPRHEQSVGQDAVEMGVSAFSAERSKTTGGRAAGPSVSCTCDRATTTSESA
jgi:hypothetical protein